MTRGGATGGGQAGLPEAVFDVVENPFFPTGRRLITAGVNDLTLLGANDEPGSRDNAAGLGRRLIADVVARGVEGVFLRQGRPKPDKGFAQARLGPTREQVGDKPLRALAMIGTEMNEFAAGGGLQPILTESAAERSM